MIPNALRSSADSLERKRCTGVSLHKIADYKNIGEVVPIQP